MGEESAITIWKIGLKYYYVLALIVLENNNSQSVFLASRTMQVKTYK